MVFNFVVPFFPFTKKYLPVGYKDSCVLFVNVFITFTIQMFLYERKSDTQANC